MPKGNNKNHRMLIDRTLQLATENHISQKDLASGIGIHASNITDWKMGRSYPAIDTLSKIAVFFNVSVDYLLGKTDEKRPAAETGDEPSPMFDGLPLTKDETRLLSQYRSLNRQGKEYILQTLDMAVNVYKKEVSVSDVEAADVG